MNYKGIVFFDVDGTLIHYAAGITQPTPKTMEALRRLKSNGYLIALATGRAKCYFVPGLEIFDTYTCTNGSYTEVDKTPVSDIRFSLEEIQQLDDIFNSLGINYLIESRDICFVKNKEDAGYQGLVHIFGLPDEKFPPFTDFSAAPFYKYIVIGNQEKIVALRELLGDRYDITGTPGSSNCDFCKKGINKAYGAKQIIDYLGFSQGETYAFGDADNDRAIFQMVKHGIAMGEHFESLDSVTEFVTDTVKGEGIWKGLCHYGLI